MLFSLLVGKSKPTTGIKYVAIKLERGDICDEKVDAIVNGSNDRLDLTKGMQYRNKRVMIEANISY